MVDCSKDNIGSALSIKAFDGKLVKEEYIVDLECIKQDYCINVKEAIYKYSKLYDEYVTLTSEEKIK